MKHTWMLIALATCEGSISNRAIYSDASAAFQCPATVDVRKDILTAKCATAGWHTSVSPIANLDLESPGVAMRMYGVEASQCRGQLLLDDKIPFAGYVFDKVS